MAAVPFKRPKREDYRNESSYNNALQRYRIGRRARYVWGQIPVEERVYVLEEAGHPDPGGAAAVNDPRKLRLSPKQLKMIADYPRSEHRREVYQAKLKASPRQKDARVRKHERRLREGGQ